MSNSLLVEKPPPAVMCPPSGGSGCYMQRPIWGEWAFWWGGGGGNWLHSGIFTQPGPELGVWGFAKNSHLPSALGRISGIRGAECCPVLFKWL